MCYYRGMRNVRAIRAMPKWLKRPRQILTYLGVMVLLCSLAACGSAPTAPSDPPGALVRLQRADNATTLPGDLTIFSTGDLQLYIGDRGALRKQVPLADLSDLQTALADPALRTVADTYPATLPTGAGDTLTIYGARRRSIRYDQRALNLPPALQRVVSEVMRLRGRF